MSHLYFHYENWWFSPKVWEIVKSINGKITKVPGHGVVWRTHLDVARCQLHLEAACSGSNHPNCINHLETQSLFYYIDDRTITREQYPRDVCLVDLNYTPMTVVFAKWFLFIWQIRTEFLDLCHWTWCWNVVVNKDSKISPLRNCSPMRVVSL